MPLYDFECACGKHFQQSFSMADVPTGIPCTCGSTAAKIITGCALIKGGTTQELRRQDEFDRILQLMDEPASDSEIQTGKEMLKERERMLGKPEGSLSGDYPKEQVEVESKLNVGKMRAAIDRLDNTTDPVEQAVIRKELRKLEGHPEKKKVRITRNTLRGRAALKKDVQRSQRLRGA